MTTPFFSSRGRLAVSLSAAFLVPLGPAFARDEGKMPIAEFTHLQEEKLEWSITDDGVMGGLSKGTVDFADDGTLVFSGTLSLENNGGFSTVRSKRLSLNLSAFDGLMIRVKGDGRTYQLRVSTDERYRGDEVSFRAEFPTTKGEWVTCHVPFSNLQAGHHGRDLERPFDPAKVQRVGLLLADKQAGEFHLEVDWIRAYRDGDVSDDTDADLTKARAEDDRRP